jgi:hypothetical protein
MISTRCRRYWLRTCLCIFRVFCLRRGSTPHPDEEQPLLPDRTVPYRQSAQRAQRTPRRDVYGGSLHPDPLIRRLEDEAAHAMYMSWVMSDSPSEESSTEDSEISLDSPRSWERQLSPDTRYDIIRRPLRFSTSPAAASATEQLEATRNPIPNESPQRELSHTTDDAIRHDDEWTSDDQADVESCAEAQEHTVDTVRPATEPGPRRVDISRRRSSTDQQGRKTGTKSMPALGKGSAKNRGVRRKRPQAKKDITDSGPIVQRGFQC